MEPFIILTLWLSHKATCLYMCTFPHLLHSFICVLSMFKHVFASLWVHGKFPPFHTWAVSAVQLPVEVTGAEDSSVVSVMFCCFS